MQRREISQWSHLKTRKAIFGEYANRLASFKKSIKHSVIAYTPDEKCVLGKKGESFGLAPCLVKDIFHVNGWPTTASSTFLSSELGDVLPTSEFVSRLQTAGYLMVGKTHLNEFAYGLSGENAHYGDCPHPNKLAKKILSGGSSSGSAFAVGSGLVPLALGTDTGGSIRVPASFCGVWGIRYIPGEMMNGCFPLAPSFDTVGYFCNSKEDLIKVHCELYPSANTEANALLKRGLLLPDWCENDEVYKVYQAAFAEREVEWDEPLAKSLNEWMQILPKAFSVLQSLEALEVHRDWLDKYKKMYDPSTWQRIERARHWKQLEIEEANKVKKDFNAWLNQLMADGICLILPAVPCPAKRKAALTEAFRGQLLRLTTPASIAGVPVVTEPLQISETWKTLGIQYVYSDIKNLFR